MSKNLLKSLALSALVCTGSVAVAQNIPDGNTWYRLVSHATTQDRDNTCIELVSDLSDGLHTNGSHQNNRLWSAAKAEDGAANLDYQYWQFVEDPANAGNYAMVCKAKPEGSVNSTPTAQNNTGRWDYDATAKHYDFQFVAGDYQKEVDGVYSLAIRSTKQNDGWYMNIAAGGQGFAVNCYDNPTDGDGGLFYFEAAPVVVDYDLSSLGVRNNAGNRSERYLSSVVLSVNGGEEVTIGPISSSSDYSIYYDKHDQSFSAPAGAEVTVTLGGAGSWIHNYAYVDWASDGFNYSAPTDYVDLDTYLPLEGSDLVWYSCWRKSTSDSDPWKNSRGETVSNNQNTNGATYTFTIPADTPAGDYRMRVKTAWQSLDPNGKIDTSASNNTIQDNGGTIVDFTLTVTEAPVVEPAHTYMYFEANRKAGWGSYLQDANEPVQGSYASSTLCGSELLTANCVWEITPGTVDGAYHVQNFVTKKYLVNLVDGGGSTTLDEPINIWFHDFSWDGNNGIQIGTGATVNGNCLDQDNHDSLVGIWANDAGNLWFKTTMEATTPEEVEAFFNEGEDPRVAVIQQKIDDTKALCELYKVSAPMAAETIDELMTAFEAFTPEYVLEQGLYDELDEMIASAVVTPVEEAVVAALNESLAGNYYWTLQGMRRANANMASYLSAGTTSTNQNYPSFVPVKTPTDGTDWYLVSNGTEGQFIMQNVFSSKYIGTPQVHYCKVVDTPEEAGAFTFGVRGGYVIFNSVAFPTKGLSFDGNATDPVEIYDVLSDAGAIWAVSVSTERGQEDPRVAEVREKLNAAFALADLYKESVPMAAEAIEEGIGSLRGYSAEFVISNGISDSMLNSLLKQAQSEVEKAVTTALNDNIEGNYWTLYEPMQPGYLSAVPKATNKGYSSFNFQAEVDKDTRWTLVPATDGQFKMLSNKGQYIGTPGQTYCKVVDSADEAGLFTLGIKEGYVNFLPVAFPGCALGLDCQNDPVEIMSLEDGSNGYRWQVSVAAIPAGGDHTYMYFEANRKAGWGTYLQDADAPVQGSYASSSLCGSDELTINCVWEITPGTEDGAYHVQNFVTKKYLVNLVANGSTTIDEPINIWFHDFSWDGKNGIQIGTGATVSNNCLDQDNHDSLLGQWADDAGNLWFQTTMDATTPEEVYAHFGQTPPAVSLIDVFCNRIDQIKEICALYLESVPFAGEEATVRIGALDQIKSAAAIYLMECTNEEEAIAAANRVALEPVEKALLADINADLTSSAYVLYNTSLNGYLSSSYNYNDGSFVTLSELNAGCMWGFDEAGNITALNSALTMKVSRNYSIGGFCGPQASDCKQPLNLSFGLKNGYVVVNATNVSGGFLSFDGAKLKVLDNTANGLWKVQKLSAADFKEAFVAQLTTWGGNVPGGAAIVEEGLAQVEAAADLSAVSAAGVALRSALEATLAPSEKAVTLKNIGANGYLGYEFGWFTQEEANEGAEFEFVSKSGDTDRYVLLNKASGMYICAGSGALAETETLASALNFVFLLHNNGHVVIRCAENNPGYQNALCVKEDGGLSYGNENNSHDGEASAYYCWSISYAGEEQSGDNEEKLAEINLRLEGVKALAESYAKHVPFAADAINELLVALDEVTAEELLDQYEIIDAYVQEYMIDPIEDTVVATVQENAGKPWTLYQPGQGAYLGCEAKATNQGWNSFNYQAEANYTGYWTAVKVSDGIYVMKSANGKFIGTPKAHYCRVEESQDEAGEFSIVAKEGYVVFNSIAHPGNSLGLDGKNDPVEIMSSEDGSRGYLWQVDLYTGDLYETVSISEIEAIADDAVIYDLQGRRVKNVSTGLYIVNGVKTMIRK